jgi:hypothetical protein
MRNAKLLRAWTALRLKDNTFPLADLEYGSKPRIISEVHLFPDLFHNGKRGYLLVCFTDHSAERYSLEDIVAMPAEDIVAMSIS